MSNTLKVRDDHAPIGFEATADNDGQRPKSDDPDFWAVWSGEQQDETGQVAAVDRDVDWKAIADDSQQMPAPAATDDQKSDAEG